MCEEDIELYVIMPMLRENEVMSHTDEEREEFNDMIYYKLNNTKFEGRYNNYSVENGYSPYTDFIDISHLNLEAADRYRQYLNNKLFNE